VSLPKLLLGLGWAQAFRARLPGLAGFEPGCANHYLFEGLLPSNTSIFCLTYVLVLSLMIIHGSGASPDIHMSCKPLHV